jgi:hypothetical protein
MYKPKKYITRTTVLLLLLCIKVAKVIVISAFVIMGALILLGALCIAGLAVLIGFPALTLGGPIALVRMCLEREEWPWEIFGKSAMEGEYAKGNYDAVPTVQWTDRSFRNQREENNPRPEIGTGAARRPEKTA